MIPFDATSPSFFLFFGISIHRLMILCCTLFILCAPMLLLVLLSTLFHPQRASVGDIYTHKMHVLSMPSSSSSPSTSIYNIFKTRVISSGIRSIMLDFHTLAEQCFHKRPKIGNRSGSYCDFMRRSFMSPVRRKLVKSQATTFYQVSIS